MILAQISDIHLDDFLSVHHVVDARSNFTAVLRDVKSRGIADVVLTGDLGEPSSLEWLFTTVREFGLRPLVLLGNHDELADFRGRPEVVDDLKVDGLYYSRTFDGVTCLFLDSSKGQLSASQLHWLQMQLAGGQDPLAVFLHHPVLDCGGTTMDRLYPMAGRDAVASLLTGCGREISVFCGHYHGAFEQRLGKIAQAVTPSTVIQLKSDSPGIEPSSRAVAYRAVELLPGRLSSRLITVG